MDFRKYLLRKLNELALINRPLLLLFWLLVVLLFCSRNMVVEDTTAGDGEDIILASMHSYTELVGWWVGQINSDREDVT